MLAVSRPELAGYAANIVFGLNTFGARFEEGVDGLNGVIKRIFS